MFSVLVLLLRNCMDNKRSALCSDEIPAFVFAVLITIPRNENRVDGDSSLRL